MTVKSLRSPWRSKNLSNRAVSFFYSLIGVWSSVITLSPHHNRYIFFWWDTLMVVGLDFIFISQLLLISQNMKYNNFCFRKKPPKLIGKILLSVWIHTLHSLFCRQKNKTLQVTRSIVKLNSDFECLMLTHKSIKCFCLFILKALATTKFFR
jgi:hypothetical protein